MSEVFKLRGMLCYNLRQTSQFSTDPIQSVYNGTESASYLGPKIWEQIPAEIKNKESLDSSKREIKKLRRHLLFRTKHMNISGITSHGADSFRVKPITPGHPIPKISTCLTIF